MHATTPTTGELHQVILENLSHPVLMFDADLLLTYLNPAAEMLLTLSTNRLLGLPATELLPADSPLMTALLRAHDSGHAFSEYDIEAALGEQRPTTMDCSITPLATSDDKGGLLMELRPQDHHRRVAQEELQITQQQTFRALVRSLAHEIKNPLGGLRGAAQLLERELPAGELHEYTRIIIGEADRLRHLVDNLLGPNVVAPKAPLNIHQVLERVRQLVQAEIPAGVRLLTDYDPSLPELLGNRDQLIQAMLNIVRNAVQALGGEGEITLRTRAKRQFTIGQQCHRLVCQVCVIDNGPGIPEALQEHIFFPMVTGRAEGTGLGLSIAQTLINQHGGLIKCHSRPGHTEFCLLLPLGTPADAATTTETTP